MVDPKRNTTTVLLAFALAGCPGQDAPSQAGTGSTTSDESQTTDVGDTDSGTTTTAADSTGDPDTTAGGVDDTTGMPPDPPLPCPADWPCQADQDGDEAPISCDNAPDHSNPDQGDMDFDSLGDVADLCPTVQSLGNTGDSDDDGIGNDCDLCRLRPSLYQGEIVLDPSYAIRNIPQQGDADRDGLGDACDNCPTVPNCLNYGVGPGLTPYEPGMPLDFEDPACQSDGDQDGIGDACESTADPAAAGPVGFGPGDDFDQDGLANAGDACPRLPASLGVCGGGAACPPDSACTDGVCNHPDPDGDGVGTECDTCPFMANPGQLTNPGADDPDEDFVGNACETDPGCETRNDPRRIGFYDVAVGGYCCTTVYQGEALEDPDGNPLAPGSLPIDEPGVLTLPPGCEAALAAAGVQQATQLTPVDVGGLDELWPHLCLLPQWDQDYDGIGDRCDLCRFAYDPDNTPYVDANGMRWPTDGAFCNGEYHCSAQRD